MATINIGGKTYSGKNITVINNKVTVDGVGVESSHPYIIKIDGNVDVVKVDACIELAINGVSGNVSTMSGDVNCRDIGGNVTTMSGDVKANKISGSVSSMSGDIN